MAAPIVYGIPGSPYLRSVMLGLEEKSAAYEFSALAFGASKQEPYLSRHPFGRIPAFEHDGFALYETQAILRYVDAVFPGTSLRPREPRQAARMNQLIGILDWYFFPRVSATISFQRSLRRLWADRRTKRQLPRRSRRRDTASAQSQAWSATAAIWSARRRPSPI
jgi:glutathione S-transferase